MIRYIRINYTYLPSCIYLSNSHFISIVSTKVFYLFFQKTPQPLGGSPDLIIHFPPCPCSSGAPRIIKITGAWKLGPGVRSSLNPPKWDCFFWNERKRKQLSNEIIDINHFMIDYLFGAVGRKKIGTSINPDALRRKTLQSLASSSYYVE